MDGYTAGHAVGQLDQGCQPRMSLYYDRRLHNGQ